MSRSLIQLSAVKAILRPHAYATREQVEAYQNRQVRRVIKHAYENVPYYRRLFDQHGIKPAQIQAVGDLASLPVTSRKDLQSQPDTEIVARGMRPQSLIARPTSGSAGEPLIVRRTWAEERLLNAFRRRAMKEYGLRARDKVAYVTLKGTSEPRDYQLPLSALQVVGFHRRTVIDSRLPTEEIVRCLRSFRPEVLVGYAGALARISAAMDETDRQAIRPRFVVAGAEMLTAQMRETIAATFEVPVYDMYGSHEFNLIAWQCKAGSAFHTCDDAVIVEVLKNGKAAPAGVPGEVAVTSLHSFAMPFLRYRLGDIATAGADICNCGQPFSTIESIQGRTYVRFSLPGGRSVYSFELWAIIRAAASWVSVYQLTQEQLGAFVLQIVTRGKPVAGEPAALTEELRTALGPGVELKVQLVREIPADTTGKYRAFRTQLDSTDAGTMAMEVADF